MVYPDPILKDLMKNLSLPNWTILEILSGQHDDGVQQQLSIKALNDRINIAPQLFRSYLALLHGANAVSMDSGLLDQRTKVVSITENGQRMLELRREL